jgi:hypothetical protein
MNTTQTIAWLICLLLAFFATILAVRASYQATLMERRFDQVQQVARDQKELLGQIRDVLQSIDRRMVAPPPAETPAAPRAQTSSE